MTRPTSGRSSAGSRRCAITARRLPTETTARPTSSDIRGHNKAREDVGPSSSVERMREARPVSAATAAARTDRTAQATDHTQCDDAITKTRPRRNVIEGRASFDADLDQASHMRDPRAVHRNVGTAIKRMQAAPGIVRKP